jgi:hypothetical protein
MHILNCFAQSKTKGVALIGGNNNIDNFSSGVAVKAAYPCSYERVVWVQSLPSPTHEACLLSVGEMKLRHLKLRHGRHF